MLTEAHKDLAVIDHSHLLDRADRILAQLMLYVEGPEEYAIQQELRGEIIAELTRNPRRANSAIAASLLPDVLQPTRTKGESREGRIRDWQEARSAASKKKRPSILFKKPQQTVQGTAISQADENHIHDQLNGLAQLPDGTLISSEYLAYDVEANQWRVYMCNEDGTINRNTYVHIPADSIRFLHLQEVTVGKEVAYSLTFRAAPAMIGQTVHYTQQQEGYLHGESLRQIKEQIGAIGTDLNEAAQRILNQLEHDALFAFLQPDLPPPSKTIAHEPLPVEEANRAELGYITPDELSEEEKLTQARKKELNTVKTPASAG